MIKVPLQRLKTSLPSSKSLFLGNLKIYVQLNDVDKWIQAVRTPDFFMWTELPGVWGSFFLIVRTDFLWFSETHHCDAHLLTCFSFRWQGKNAVIQILPLVTTVLIQSNTIKVKAIPLEQLCYSSKLNLAWGLCKTQSGWRAQKYKPEEIGNDISRNPLS